MLLARACLMSSAWRRREYRGGAHRPDVGFLWGMNGLLRSRALLLAWDELEWSGTGGGNFGFAAVAEDVNFSGWTSSRSRNRLIARKDWDIADEDADGERRSRWLPLLEGVACIT